MAAAKRHPRKVRRRVPTVLQLEVTECGAASLAMVLAYHGRVVPLEELRVACGVSRDGAKASAILNAGSRYGLKIRGLRREPRHLKSLCFPLIAHWNFAHFVVVEGFDSRGWYINDPGYGARFCSPEEFSRAFTGVVLEATPTEDFIKGGERAQLLPRVVAAAGSRRGLLAAMLLLSLLLVIPTLIFPQALEAFGQNLAGAGGLATTPTLVVLGFAILIQAAVLSLQAVVAVRVTSKVSVRLSSAMVLRMLRLPIAFHAQRGAALMAQRAGITDQLNASIAAVTITGVTSVIVATASILVLFLVDWLSGLLAAAAGALMMVLLVWASRRTMDASQRLLRDNMELGSIITSSLHQIESVKASGAEVAVVRRGSAAQFSFLGSMQRFNVGTLTLSIWPGLIGSMGALLIACVATFQVRSGDLEVGGFLAIQALMGTILGSLTALALAVEEISRLPSYLDQVEDITNAPEDPGLAIRAPGDYPGSISGLLELTDVTFGYSSASEPTIQSFALTVLPGQRIALVGRSGCGKSTVSRLLSGLYEPWSGTVTFDGLQRSEHAREVLNNSISLVDQNVSVFAGTLRDNVTLWDESIPDEDVLAALADARLDDLVTTRVGGLSTVLAEGGTDLSGGQRQRLEIARALVRNPAILIMDEATSALDPITELHIDRSIRQRGIAAVIIAHRLSTIMDSDEILCLDRGVVVERGTHAELLALGGHYADLVGAQ